MYKAKTHPYLCKVCTITERWVSYQNVKTVTIILYPCQTADCKIQLKEHHKLRLHFLIVTLYNSPCSRLATSMEQAYISIEKKRICFTYDRAI